MSYQPEQEVLDHLHEIEQKYPGSEVAAALLALASTLHFDLAPEFGEFSIGDCLEDIRKSSTGLLYELIDIRKTLEKIEAKLP